MKDLSTTTKDLSTTTKDLSTTTKDLSTTTKDLYTTTKDLYTTTKDLYTTTKDLYTVTPEETVQAILQRERIKRLYRRSLDSSRRLHLHLSQAMTPTDEEHSMTLTLRGISKDGKVAIYEGAHTTLRFTRTIFEGKQAPPTMTLEAKGLLPRPEPKAKVTDEQKAQRAAEREAKKLEREANKAERAKRIAVKKAAYAEKLRAKLAKLEGVVEPESEPQPA